MKRTPVVVTSIAAGLAAVVLLKPARASVPLSSVPAGTSAPPPTTPGGHQAPSTTAPPGAVLSATGTSEQYGYGVLAVKVSVKGRRILDVSVATLQTAESYSQQIAQQVIPMLRSEVLSAQSARVSIITGATYTCEAYLYSLQSALNRLHL
ncbi:MAG: FMN-binding protein [Actinomycetota bacterium]|nr:FMN-binding protein [Actinomycetota bacterium]